ncbi:Uncharacterized protein dnm_000430 [Desulfonema magnum]|uniref:Uncharacterized protein n=2 Tax=Desulfonema magnum TaxID=45655 RepID=A0A975BET7_9BACT|nr:Uncharacterized protein dnm_000430 [Desulfonema magnum]
MPSRSRGLGNPLEMPGISQFRASVLDLVPTLRVTAIKLRLIRGGKKSFRQGCEK